MSDASADSGSESEAEEVALPKPGSDLHEGEWVCTTGVSPTGAKVIWLARVASYDPATGETGLVHFVAGATVDGGTLYRKNKTSKAWTEHRSSLSALPKKGVVFSDAARSWLCTVNLDRLMAQVDEEAIEYAKAQLRREGPCPALLLCVAVY